MRKNLCSVRRKRMRSKTDESQVESREDVVSSVEGSRRTSSARDGYTKAKKTTILLPKRFCRSRDKGRADLLENTSASAHSVTSQARSNGNANSSSSNSSSRKMDNHLAMIFMGIVLIFLGRELQCRQILIDDSYI